MDSRNRKATEAWGSQSGSIVPTRLVTPMGSVAEARRGPAVCALPGNFRTKVCIFSVLVLGHTIVSTAYAVRLSERVSRLCRMKGLG